MGWKLGVGSAVQKRQSGVGRSIAGRVLGSRLYRDRRYGAAAERGSGDDRVRDRLSSSVATSGRTNPSFRCREAVGEVRAAFELVLSRFVDRRAVGWPSFAADNGAFEALVLGEPIERAQLGALADDAGRQRRRQGSRKAPPRRGRHRSGYGPRRSRRDGARAGHDASEGQHRLDRHRLEAVRGNLVQCRHQRPISRYGAPVSDRSPSRQEV